MHTPTILFAGVAVLSAFASAAEEPRRPRFYFPREVKRQIFTNSSSTASSTLVETTPSTLSTSTTKRFSLSDIFETLTGTSSTNAPTLSSPADTIVSTTTLTTVEPFPLPTTPTSESTGGVPSTILFPTSTPQEPTESNTRSSTTSSTSGGIIVPGPGGTLTSTAESTTSFSSSAAPPPPPEEDTPTSSSGGVTFTGPGASTAPGSTEPTSATSAPEPSTSEEPSTAVTSVEPTTLTSAEPTVQEPSATSAPSSSPSDEPTTTPEASAPTSVATSVVQPPATSEPATSAPATTEPATTEPATSEPTVLPSSSGILDITSILEPITSALSSILEPTSIADGTGSNTVVPPTSTAEPETTPTPSIPLESVISSILSTLVPTEVIPPVATAEPTTTEAPTSVIPVVTPTDIIIEPPVTNGTDPTGPPPTPTPSETTPIVTPPIETTPIETGPVDTITPTNTGVVTPTETPPPPPVTTDVPSGNDTETIITPTPPPVVTPTPLPGGNETSIVEPPVTSVPSPTASNTLTEPISTPPDSAIVIPTGSVTETTTPTITQQPTAAPNGTEPAPSATPITTVPGTTLDWGTSLIVAPTMTTQESGATASTEPTGIPSTLPKVVGNPNEQVDKSAPPGMTEVQLGFQYPLNFRFVVANAMSSAQIFAYLPEGLADGLNVTRDQVTIKNLAPLDTTAQLGFITTMARAYIPESSFRKLQASIHLPNTAIYVNNDQRVETLMNYINPAIPLQPGGSLGGSSDSGPGGPGNDEDKGKDEDPFNGQQATSSGKVNGTTAGFVVAGVGGAVAYGAAMFLIARRYKKRRQSHRRSQSLTNPSEMMQSGSPSYMGGAGAFMSGGRISPGGTNDRNSRGSGRTGNSARTAQISAPMMAENSLGWN